MEDDFETLKSIGAQRIYENTHIAKLTIEHILEKKFYKLNKVQFSGFISILEREYSLDLSALKAEFSQDIPTQAMSDNTQAVFTPKANARKQYLIIGAAALIAVAIYLLSQLSSDANNNAKIEINNTAINQIKEKIKEPILDSEELVVTNDEMQAINNNSVKEPILPTKLIIKPNARLWIGMVNLTTYKKTQRITKEEIELTGDDSWLIVCGHGNVNFELGDDILKFKDTTKVRFIYENGTLEKISKSDFIASSTIICNKSSSNKKSMVIAVLKTDLRLIVLYS